MTKTSFWPTNNFLFFIYCTIRFHVTVDFYEGAYARVSSLTEWFDLGENDWCDIYQTWRVAQTFAIRTTTLVEFVSLSLQKSNTIIICTPQYINSRMAHWRMESISYCIQVFMVNVGYVFFKSMKSKLMTDKYIKVINLFQWKYYCRL